MHRISVMVWALAVAAVSAGAAVQPATMPAGSITCLASSDGVTLYAGTALGGIYRSDTGGARWSACGPTGLSPELNGLALDQTGALYAATGSGLARSRDQGATWEAILHVPTLSAAGVGQNGATVLAGTEGAGLLASTDGGQSFRPLTARQPFGMVRKVVVHPSRPDRIFIGTEAGVYVSTDGGANWSARNDGLSWRPVRALCIDPCNPDLLFVATQDKYLPVGGNGRLYRSTDAGSSWSTVLEEICLTDVTVNRQSSNDVAVASFYSGVYISHQGGASGTWNNHSVGLTSRRVWSLLYGNYGLYAGTSSGVFGRALAEQDWAGLSSGILAANVRSLARAGADGNSWLAGCREQQVWRSQDGGASWSLSATGFSMLHHDVLDVEVDPTNPNLAYAGTEGFLLYHSSNGGATWNWPGSSGYPFVTDVSLDPNNASRLYMAIFLYGVFRSDDRGQNWSSVTGNIDWTLVNLIQAVPGSPNSLLVGCVDGYLYRSENGGANYTKVIINPGIWVRTGVRSMLVCQEQPQTVLLATDRGLHRSVDGGRHFYVAVPERPQGVFDSVVQSPSHPQVLYAGTDHGQVLRSDNWGANWYVYEPAAGLPDGQLRALAVHPQDPGRLLAGFDGHGIWLITP